MGDLKICLKEAKSSIKDKDFEAAYIHCKDALKIDRKNYQALVMFGRVCLELRKFSDSKKVLLLATQIDPENPIAWQGLSSLHEKGQSCFEKSEEIAILTHLKDITNEQEKLHKIYRRLAEVYQRYNCILDAASVLESLLTISTDATNNLEIHKSIIGLLENAKDSSPQILQKLSQHYKCTLSNYAVKENETNYQSYLRLLWKIKAYKRLLEGARDMAKVFPTAYPLEWIARAYVEYCNYSCQSHTVEGEEDILITDENLASYINKLLQLYRGSPWGNFAQGLIYLKKKDAENAKLRMQKGCNALETNMNAWLALLQVQIDSGDIYGIEETGRKVSSLLSDPAYVSSKLTLPEQFSTVDDLRQYLLVTRVDALFKLGHIKHLEKAVVLLNDVEEKSLEMRLLLVRAQVKLGMMSEACQELEDAKREHGQSIPVQMVAAHILASKEDFSAANAIYERILQEDSTNAEAFLEMGKCCFGTKNYQKALVYLLKAAKYDPKMGSSFLYIGHYYRLHDNMDKAKKCYEKALQLNPCDEEAGASLSDVYRITGQDEENFALLVRVTNEGKSGWAWLRLGLHYLALVNYNEAIKALQRAVEVNAKDRVCLECLGDAYLARGSLTAALKVFTKTTELHPEMDTLYSRCRIAFINHMVGELLLSISQYEEVLSKSLPEAIRIVALVGLAQVLLMRAKKYKQEQLLANMRDDCLYAIRCLTKAALENSKNVTIWKLLGDACTLPSLLPSSLAKYVVPSRLLDASVLDVDQMEKISREELLQLGGRCYGVGLQVDENNSRLWHDLGVNVFLQGYSTLKLTQQSKIAPNETSVDSQEMVDADVIQRALTSVKKSLSLDASCSNAWNSLGVIAFFKANYSLAQHAFINSLELQSTVDAWTHLGALYLHQSEAHLAHEAFSQAQALDPAFVASWVGQAMVATSVGHYEAFDLYRHTTLLGINPESCVGFASNVLRVACGRGKGAAQNVDQFLANVADSLTQYTREKEDDAIAQNMLGLSLELLGLNHGASGAFAKAVEASKDNEDFSEEMRDGILCNYGRSLTSLSNLPEAIESFSNLKEPDFVSQCSLALSLLKDCQFENSYQRYMEAYEWYAPDEAEKANVLVALAFLQYKFQSIEDVKTFLFQSCSVQGLLALTCLGLIQEDATLTAAALAELEPHTDSQDYAHHVAFLKATQATMQNNTKEAKLILSRALHRHPHNSALWRALSRHLLVFPAKKVCAEAANAAASAARALAQASGDNSDVFQDVLLKAMAHLKVAAASSSAVAPPPPSEGGRRKKKEAQKKEQAADVVTKKEKEEKTKRSLIEAQRAVLMCPSKPETWAVLIAAIDSKPKASSFAKKWSQQAQPVLKSWLESVSIL